MLSAFAWIALGAGGMLAARLALARVWSFAAQRPEDYAAETPALDLRAALSGRLTAEGVIYDYTGRVNTRFVAAMNGVWEGDSGVLTEDFRYSSGRAQRREWSLKLGEDGAVEATAPDVIGVGRGVCRGDALRLAYRIRLDDAAGGHVLDVTDWMYLLENGTILNRSQFRKFGIRVAELVATLRREA